MDENIARVQWFPGHMAKTRRMIQDNLKYVDIVVELRDARIPQSSANPELKSWINNKKRIILLNKSDTADPRITKLWMDYYRKQGEAVLAVDSKSGKGLNQVVPFVREQLSEMLERYAQKGAVGKAIRMMVVGIPNVGKSSFINRMAGTKQWVTVGGGIELLDMPGVLWPKFEDPLVGEKLAFTGAVKDQIMDTELLAARLLSWLREEYPQMLLERLKMKPEETEGLGQYELLELAGKKRGMLISGGEVNTERAAAVVLDEYRAGKFGKISLEVPPREEA